MWMETVTYAEAERERESKRHTNYEKNTVTRFTLKPLTLTKHHP